MDLNNVLDGWVKSGSAINVNVTDYSVPDYYVIDLRSATDFDAGHIKGAHNSTLGNILDEASIAAGKPILVVCYTGQTAARGVGALRLMGFEAYSLKWGMSGWHADLAGKWNSNATDFASPNWVTTGAPPENTAFEFPTLATGKTTGAEILEARVKTALANPSWTVTKTDALSTPGNYFINNKWPLASWDEYGHINGAVRIDEDLLISGVKFLDPDKTVLTYCYTGQTSAITTLWLDVLGYDAKSLLFGANGIVYTSLLTGTAGNGPKVSWKGAGSGSEMNFGFYETSGTYHPPL
jgi:rhodanese-related sulfurtransferase